MSMTATVFFAGEPTAGIRDFSVDFDTGLMRDDFNDGAVDREECRALIAKLYHELHDWPCSVLFDDEHSEGV